MTYPHQPGSWTDPYQQPGYPVSGYPAYGYPAAATLPTNGTAVASMVVSIAAAFGLLCYGLGGYVGIVGAILGHVSRRQICARGEGGDGMALAGIITGWIATGLALIATAFLAYFIVLAVRQDPAFAESY